jgi:hypothetical protein
MHDVGLAAAIHHLGWVDHGEPAEEQPFMIRSCETYVPGVRHAIRFPEAAKIGLPLNHEEFRRRYCECAFCAGSFDNGKHPLDLLLGAQTITMRNGQQRRTPTSQGVGANTWHYLLSRRLEIKAFSNEPAATVIAGDIERAASLNRVADATRLGHLASELGAA